MNPPEALTQVSSGFIHLRTMTLLSQAVEAKKFDTRLQERNLQRGLLKPEELNSQAAHLSDDSEFAEYVSLDAISQGDGKKRIPANGKSA